MLSHITSKYIKMLIYAINFATLLFKKKKKKIFSLLVYKLHFFQLLSPPFVVFSLLYRYISCIISSLFYFNFSSPHLILYKFDIISPIQFIFFSHTKNVSTLSLSLWIFVLSYSSNLGWWALKKKKKKFPIHKSSLSLSLSLSLLLIALVGFWFELILSWGNYTLSIVVYLKKHFIYLWFKNWHFTYLR